MLLNIPCAKALNVIKWFEEAWFDGIYHQNSLIWCENLFNPFAYIQGLVENEVILS